MKQKLPSLPHRQIIDYKWQGGPHAEAQRRGEMPFPFLRAFAPLRAVCPSCLELLVRLSVTLSPSRLPLLITGVSGVAGYNALFYFRARYPGCVVGVRPTQTWQFVADDIVALDTEDRAG